MRILQLVVRELYGAIIFGRIMICAQLVDWSASVKINALEQLLTYCSIVLSTLRLIVRLMSLLLSYCPYYTGCSFALFNTEYRLILMSPNTFVRSCSL